MGHFIRQVIRQRDWPSLGLLLTLGLAGIWVAMLPLSHFVQGCYLNRFHLKTDHYGGWAIQQLSPAMYNLENTFWYSQSPLTPTEQTQLAKAYFHQLQGREPAGYPVNSNGQASTGSPQPMMDMLNHFPTRVMTFVNARGTLKRLGGQGYFYFRSEYRSRRLDSLIEIRRVNDHCSEVIRREVVDE